MDTGSDPADGAPPVVGPAPGPAVDPQLVSHRYRHRTPDQCGPCETLRPALAPAAVAVITGTRWTTGLRTWRNDGSREHGARGAWWACVESDAQPAERAEVDRDLDLDWSIVNGREGLALMSIVAEEDADGDADLLFDAAVKWLLAPVPSVSVAGVPRLRQQTLGDDIAVLPRRYSLASSSEGSCWALLEVVRRVPGPVDDLPQVRTQTRTVAPGASGQLGLKHDALLTSSLIGLLPDIVVDLAGDQPEVPLRGGARMAWILSGNRLGVRPIWRSSVSPATTFGAFSSTTRCRLRSCSRWPLPTGAGRAGRRCRPSRFDRLLVARLR